jgi:hypothetical protein
MTKSGWEAGKPFICNSLNITCQTFSNFVCELDGAKENREQEKCVFLIGWAE